MKTPIAHTCSPFSRGKFYAICIAAALVIQGIELFRLSAQEPVLISAPYGGAYSPDTYSREPISTHVPSSYYQQVYAANEFERVRNSGGGWIEQVSFQTDFEFGRGLTTYLDLEISIGLTARNADDLSPIFSDNPLGEMSVIHSRGIFLLTATSSGGLVDFVFENPFLYNPAAGNLLLEIRNYSQIPGPPDFAIPGVLEAWDIRGDSVSRVYAHDVNATTGTADSMGLTTHFVITPVPEPSTFALLGLSLAGLCWWLRRFPRHT